MANRMFDNLIPYTDIHEMNLDWIIAKVKEYIAKTELMEINFEDLKKYVLTNIDEIKTYVDNYFDNLDVQDEINNKLDEMLESGQLAEIIAQFIKLQGLITFNTLSDMKNADNLNDGSNCLIMGTNLYNDGKTRLYKIRTLTSSDVVDEINIVSLTNYPTLIGELINNLFREDYEQLNIFTDSTNNGAIYGINIGKNNLELIKGNPYFNIKDFANTGEYDITMSGPLNGTTSHDGVLVDDTILEPCYYLGWNNSENGIIFKYKNLKDGYTPQDLADCGQEGCCIFSPIIENGYIYNIPSNIMNAQLMAGTFRDYIYDRRHPRTVIAQKNNNTYLLVFSGRGLNNEGYNYPDLQNYLISKGYTLAFNLDGGGSTSLFLESTKINPVQENTIRSYPALICVKDLKEE